MILFLVPWLLYQRGWNLCLELDLVNESPCRRRSGCRRDQSDRYGSIADWYDSNHSGRWHGNAGLFDYFGAGANSGVDREGSSTDRQLEFGGNAAGDLFLWGCDRLDPCLSDQWYTCDFPGRLELDGVYRI